MNFTNFTKYNALKKFQEICISDFTKNQSALNNILKKETEIDREKLIDSVLDFQTDHLVLKNNDVNLYSLDLIQLSLKINNVNFVEFLTKKITKEDKKEQFLFLLFDAFLKSKQEENDFFQSFFIKNKEGNNFLKTKILNGEIYNEPAIKKQGYHSIDLFFLSCFYLTEKNFLLSIEFIKKNIPDYNFNRKYKYYSKNKQITGNIFCFLNEKNIIKNKHLITKLIELGVKATNTKKIRSETVLNYIEKEKIKNKLFLEKKYNVEENEINKKNKNFTLRF